MEGRDLARNNKKKDCPPQPTIKFTGFLPIKFLPPFLLAFSTEFVQPMESKFDFLATRQCLVKIGEGQQKIKIVPTNRQSNLPASCQSIFCANPSAPP